MQTFILFLGFSIVTIFECKLKLNQASDWGTWVSFRHAETISTSTNTELSSRVSQQNFFSDKNLHLIVLTNGGKTIRRMFDGKLISASA